MNTAMQPGQVAQLPLAIIDRDPQQPRTDFDKASLRDLSADIAAHGVQQPITVRPHPEKPGRYYIVYGERRTRASKMAKLETIPALLLGEQQPTDPLRLMLGQVKENHNRRDLNGMEWAEVLTRMRTDHGIKSLKEIETTLKANGIHNIGRSYISNLVRLAELPPWAQAMIRAERLSAAHGKYLLTATCSPQVIEALEDALTEDDGVTVRGLQNLIFNYFMSFHEVLDGHTCRFDWKESCVGVGCQKMRKAAPADGDSYTFCLDSECYQGKQQATVDSHREALEAHSDHQDDDPPEAPERIELTPQQPAEQQPLTEQTPAAPVERDPNDYVTVSIDRDNPHVVNGTLDLDQHDNHRWASLEPDWVRFSPHGCTDCPHRIRAIGGKAGESGIDACFNLDCYNEKHGQGDEFKDRVLDALVVLLEMHIRANRDLPRRLLTWFAAGRPSFGKKRPGKTDFEYIVSPPESMRDQLEEEGMTTLTAFVQMGNLGPSYAVACALLQRMDPDELAELATACGIGAESLPHMDNPDYRHAWRWLTRNQGDAPHA